MNNGIDYFSNKETPKELQNRAVFGFGIAGVAQAVQLGVQICAIAILTRLLGPADFGLVAMSAILLGFANIFVVAGLSTATVQRQNISHQQVSNLFWCSVALGMIVLICVASIAPVVAWIFSEPRLIKIIWLSTPIFPIMSLCAQHEALLKRRLKFGTLAIIQTVSAMSGAISSITWACLFENYWALVVSPVAAALVRMVLVMFTSGWRPGLPRKDSGTGDMLKFGANLTGASILSFTNRNADDFLLGYTWGSSQLGIYNLAYRLILLPIQRITVPFTAVTIPVLSRLVDEPQKYREFYCLAIKLITSIGMPIVCIAAVLIDDITILFFHEEWRHVATVYLALLPFAFLGTFNTATGWVLIPTGRVDRHLRLFQITILLDMCCLIVGLRWGAVGVALGLSVSRTLFRFPALIYGFKGTPVSLSIFFNAIRRPAIASISSMLITFQAFMLTPMLNSYLKLFVEFLCFTSLYVSTWILQPGGRSDLRCIAEFLKEFRHQRNKDGQLKNVK